MIGRPTFALGAALVLVGSLAGAGGTTRATRREAPPATFGVGVENVNVDVSVTRGGRPIEGLTAADFAVTDNGVPQRVEVVEHEGTAVDALLVLDASSSVRGRRLEDLQQAAHAFVDALWSTDSVTLITFATDLRLAAPSGASRADAHAAIDRLRGSGATVLVDAAYAALLLADPRRGRPLILIFSDGVDHGSWLAPEAALATARASDAVVDYVEIEGALTFLEPLASEAGGRGWSAHNPGELKGAFVEVLEEFKSRYRLRYEPQGVRREGWHELRVRLVGKQGKVQARRGYQVPGGAGGR